MQVGLILPPLSELVSVAWPRNGQPSQSESQEKPMTPSRSDRDAMPPAVVLYHDGRTSPNFPDSISRARVLNDKRSQVLVVTPPEIHHIATRVRSTCRPAASLGPHRKAITLSAHIAYKSDIIDLRHE